MLALPGECERAVADRDRQPGVPQVGEDAEALDPVSPGALGIAQLVENTREGQTGGGGEGTVAGLVPELVASAGVLQRLLEVESAQVEVGEHPETAGLELAIATPSRLGENAPGARLRPIEAQELVLGLCHPGLGLPDPGIAGTAQQFPSPLEMAQRSFGRVVVQRSPPQAELHDTLRPLHRRRRSLGLDRGLRGFGRPGRPVELTDHTPDPREPDPCQITPLRTRIALQVALPLLRRHAVAVERLQGQCPVVEGGEVVRLPADPFERLDQVARALVPGVEAAGEVGGGREGAQLARIGVVRAPPLQDRERPVRPAVGQRLESSLHRASLPPGSRPETEGPGRLAPRARRDRQPHTRGERRSGRAGACPLLGRAAGTEHRLAEEQNDDAERHPSCE